ncbi:hypothetical protein [Microbacterium sp. zg.Y909]|uniref:hypothetical protein n=1 Tax=Microbacterium sp. zg.Y909 TaxID=2969413 RepID=UPI00214C6784|nr:hypothetical protein [Microbacterium sp. zg.Y909]MCR2825154.1 hypothetical protein [Microbacterium sp. zg.Y909]
MSDEQPETMPIAAADDVGSERLAQALAAVDVAGIGRALRADYVVVPLTRGPDGQTQTRVIAASDPEGERKWELHLFSSTRTYAAFLGDASEREFALQAGTALLPLLDAYLPLLRRVVFDAAGPHPVQATPEDVRASLEPRPDDDEVQWITGEATEHGLRPGETVTGFDLFLGEGWAQIDLTAPEHIQRDVGGLVTAQLQGLPSAPVLRGQITAWLQQTARTAAAGGGRLLAFLTRRTHDAAAALSVTQYWQPLGPSTAQEHLDAVGARLQAGLGEHDQLHAAETAGTHFLRHTTRRMGPAELAGRPLGVVDYWLAFPDGRGLCLVSFSTPHIEQLEQVRLLADNIILNAAWAVAPVPTEPTA